MMAAPACPFYGMHDRFGKLHPSHGNQCALVRPYFSACLMEMTGFPVAWEKCLYRSGPVLIDQSNPGCIARCVACNRPSHVCRTPTYCDAVAKGLCPTCLHRAELLALEAAGQGRLIP